MENSTTANNIGLFQTQNVKKIKLTENFSFSNEVFTAEQM